MAEDWFELTEEDMSEIHLLWCNCLAQYFWDATSKANSRYTCTELERHQAQQFLLRSNKPLDEICDAAEIDTDFVRYMVEGLAAKDWQRPAEWTERSALGDIFSQLNHTKSAFEEAMPGKNEGVADYSNYLEECELLPEEDLPEGRERINGGSMATAVRYE